MLQKEELLLLSYFIAVILLLTVFFVIFFSVFQKRKNKLLFEKWEEKRRYEKEIFDSRIEIQEQTLKNVGMELHDNIGQLLSVAKIQLNMLGKSGEVLAREQLTELSEVIGNSIKEVRSLSKSLNAEVVGYMGLVKSVQNELERFNRHQLLHATFETSGELVEINQKDSIILFRILQEFFSNVIKHAGASELRVTLRYGQNLHIEVKDNGRGFQMEEVEHGSGLINMKSRASLIGAVLSIYSEIGKGTRLMIHFPIQ